MKADLREADVIAAMERRLGPAKAWRLQVATPLAVAALAVSATKQDVMILGALPRNERLSLLALLIAEHLRGAPAGRVLLLGTRRGSLEKRLEKLHRSASVDVKCHLDLILARTLAGSPKQVLRSLCP